MCRILGVLADAPVDAGNWIQAFADRCEASPEYQGHGWGAAWWTGTGWRHYRSLRPIWEDGFVTPDATCVLVHARSAFRNEGIEIENNMPFVDASLAFAFNGELHGVRLNVPGATGAARLFHLLRRFRTSADGDTVQALARLDEVVARRSERVRAMNVVVADGASLVFSSRFTQEAPYFTMHAASVPELSGMRMVASEPLQTSRHAPEWTPIPEGTTGRLGATGDLLLTRDDRVTA